MRCPFCKERIKKGAKKCKHCHSIFDDSQNAKGGLSYLENGFAKIEEECDALEEKVNIIIGAIFKRHKYSEDDLLSSGHMDKIKSFAGKISDDVNRWEEAGQFSFRLRLLYNENAQAVQSRVSIINRMIRERQPTLSEKVGEAFTRLYKTILKLLPQFARSLLTIQKRRFFNKEAA
jgi:hypothetical protein